MREIGLDVHREFCEVAIAEAGEVRSAGRIETKPEVLELFTQSLGADDRVALEVSGNAWEIARIIEPHLAQVLVVSPSETGIRQARAKTDRLDARALAKLLAAGSLEGLWRPDEETRALRRRLSRRAQLVKGRTRAKNEIHAALMRRLVPKPKLSDLFGLQGRRWLSEAELPADERETVDSCMRQIEFYESEFEQVERVIAQEALTMPEVGRLMSVPGVNVITATTFLAAIGEIDRFPSPRRLVGYLGLDPRVRQSGEGPTARGPISKQGSAPARWALVEAAWSVVNAPGPLRAFYQRLRARRGAQVAIVATARKLACLFWHPLRGLRLRAALADPQEAAPARAHRRCPKGQGQLRARRLVRERRHAQGRARAGEPGRARLRAQRPRLAGGRSQEEGRGRDTGARISWVV